MTPWIPPWIARTIGVLRDGNRQETEGFEGVVRVASGGTELRARAADNDNGAFMVGGSVHRFLWKQTLNIYNIYIYILYIYIYIHIYIYIYTSKIK